MADIDVGTIGGSLELADKSFSNTLREGDKALIKFQSTSDQADEAIKRLDRDFATVEKGVAKFEASLKGAQPEILTVGKLVSGLADEAIASINPWTALGTAVTVTAGAVVAAGVAIAAGIVAATTKAADLGDELLTLSKQTGVSVESLSVYKFVAEQTGVSLGNISSGISKFTADLGKGSKTFESAVSALGLSITNLRNSKPEDAFQKVIEALGKVPNAADQAALGAQVFGTKFRQLSGLIGEDVRGMRKDVEAFGGIVTEEMGVAGDMFNDAKARLGAMVSAAEVQFGSIFVPAIAAAFKVLGDAWIDARDKSSISATRMTEIVDKFVTNTVKATGYVIQAIGALSYILVSFFAADQIKDFKIVEDLAKIARIAANTASAVAAVFGLDIASKMSASLRDIMKDVEDFNKSVGEGVEPVSKMFKDAAISVVEFGSSMVKSADGAVAKMKDEIAKTAAEARKANGDFQGLGETVDKTAEKFHKWLDKIDFNTILQAAAASKKFFKEQLDQANRTAKAQADLFKEEMSDREDADRTMRRLTQSATQFELGELQKRLDKQKAFYAVLELVGVDTSRALVAAEEKTGIAMVEVMTKTDGFKQALANILAMMGPFSGGIIAGTRVLGDMEGQFDDTLTKANEFKQAMANLGEQVGSVLGNLLKGDLDSALGGVRNILTNQISTLTEKGISEGLKNGTLSAVGAFAKGLSGAIAVAGVTEMIAAAIRVMQSDEKRAKAKAAGEAMAASFIDGFGSVEKMHKFGIMAGIDPAILGQLAHPFSGEQFQDAMTKAIPLLEEYKHKLESLGTAAAGVNRLMAGVGASFEKSAKEQMAASKMANQAVLDAMKTAGATSEELEKKAAYLDEELTKKTFTATDAQIAAFNRVGTIAAGVIANTVRETGNLVEAVLSVKDTLGGLDEIRDKFNLGDQMNTATTEVLKLYDAIIANEDVFTSISGIGQVMDGLGDAMVANSDLANAFGDQLAADFQTLKDRGVDANLALASMAPQLQQLWELAEDGRITVDATTQALLDQAEAQGVVGKNMRDVNEKILDVLTEIKDLLGYIGGKQLPDLGKAGDAAGKQVAGALDATNEAGRSASGAIATVQNGLDGLKAPPPFKVRVDFEAGDMPDLSGGETWRPHPAGPGERPEDNPFAGGSDGFRNFSDGTPAMLHGLERVQTFAQYQNERAGGTSAMPPGVIIQIDGETIVAVNARNKTRWELIRTGTSPRTVR